MSNAETPGLRGGQSPSAEEHYQPGCQAYDQRDLQRAGPYHRE